MIGSRSTFLRRLVIFFAALLFLGLSGLGLLLFRWSGDRGEPPAGRLYVHGDFAGSGPLATLRPAGRGSACYRVEVEGGSAAAEVCRGKRLRLWVEDALLDLSVGARGVPRVSIAGLRAREGDWLGSLADPNRPHPRFPLRAAGVPSMAARVVACPPPSPSAPLCLESHDRLGRLAVAGTGGRVEVLGSGEVHPLHPGDALWLGLVAFAVDVEGAGENGPALVLDRVDRLRPRHVRSPKAVDLGGDRRWLGRLWHSEAPDPGLQTPERFEIHPMRVRYTTYDLSRQRTNFEGEDVLQRLIDGGWLCLETVGPAAEPRVAWRPLDRPGCTFPPGGDRSASLTAGITPSIVEDYRRARFGDLSYLAGSLVNAAGAALAERSYLEDATGLPFVFDWRLGYGASRAADGRRVPQPVPRSLWGVRFGSTRQIRRSPDFRRGLPPTVLPRATTARHLVQLLGDGELVASFYFPGDDNPDEDSPGEDNAGAAPRGALCLGRHRSDGAEAVSYRPSSGSHLPLGSAAFGDDPRTGSWSPDPDAPCAGCRLALEVRQSAEGESELVFAFEGECNLEGGALRHGEELTWGAHRLRYVERGDGPWLAATDPGTGRRHFAEEFYLRGLLQPLLGDAAALSGIEAALREYLQDTGEVGIPRDLASLELTIDGDLQLQAAAIVEALARPQIAGDDPQPHRVSVTAAILDARGGDLLGLVNWSSLGSEQGRRSAWVRPTTWELGSGQADVLENVALLRRRAIGSTMKITGSYALLNNGLAAGGELDGATGRSFLEAPVGRGRLYLDRGVAGERPSPRRCSTGPHFLPASDAGFTADTFVARFAASCNNFFVLTGFRHAAGRPARLSSPRLPPPDGAGPGELLIDRRRRDQPIMVHPSPEVQSLAERIRDGLAADFAAESRLPRSVFGVLLRLGFQPRPDLFPVPGEAPAELRLDHRGQPVVMPLAHGWFAPGDPGNPGPATPALRPGRDFSYLGIASPGRMDEATVRGEPVHEVYDGEAREVRRLAEGRADVQYSMLMIGQSSVEASAVGLGLLYAPAARQDGRAVSPCLFRANCGPQRAGARVIDGPAAEVLNRALSGVVRYGTAAGGFRRVGRRELAGRGWGGKTGTYQVEVQELVGLSAAEWERLRAWACGVGGVERPVIHRGGSRAAELAAALGAAPAGSALGARTCEDPDLPLNPAGVQAYGGGEMPARLDELAAELARSAETEIETYHSFVALVPPARGAEDEGDRTAEGMIVAVMVDRQTADGSLAVQIGGELAAAVERWVASVRPDSRP